MFLSFLLRFHVNLRTEVVKAISQKVYILEVRSGKRDYISKRLHTQF